MESDEGRDIGDRLSLSVEVVINGQELPIKHLPVNMPKTIKFNTDPDWEFHDTVSKSEATGWTISHSEVEDEEAELLNTL